MKRVVFAIAIFLFLITSLFLMPDVPTASAHSAMYFHPLTSCKQDQCNGQDPSKLGCVPGAILRWYQYLYNPYSSVPTGRIEQWYSPTCNAIWTNVQTINNVTVSFISAGLNRSLDNSDVYNLYNSRQNVHSPMLGFWGSTCYSSRGNISGDTSSFSHCYV
jgi:hypothetical protein